MSTYETFYQGIFNLSSAKHIHLFPYNNLRICPKEPGRQPGYTISDLHQML